MGWSTGGSGALDAESEMFLGGTWFDFSISLRAHPIRRASDWWGGLSGTREDGVDNSCHSCLLAQTPVAYQWPTSGEESLGKPEGWELGSAGISTDFGVEMGDLGPRTSMIAFCFSGPGYDR